jgi:hypothetical protein
MHTGLSQVPGAQLFDNSKTHEIKVSSLYKSLIDTLSNNYVLSFGFGQVQTRKIPYAPALITIDGTDLDTIGIRHKGFNSWWNSVKKPIKIDINKYKDQRYDGLSKFNLHNGSGDPSFIRESVSYQILRSMGIPAPRTAYAKVFIDDTYLGLYHLVEQVDNTFLDANYGGHEGNLYVQQSKGSGGFGLDWISDKQEDYYASLELENHEKENDWSALLHFIDVLNNSSDANFKSEIESLFGVDEYLAVVAFDVAINNLDWYGSSGRNYYLAEVNGKIHWQPWDYNLSWREDAKPLDISPDDFPVLIKRLLDQPTFHDQFVKKYCALLPYFESETFNTMIDEEAALITTHLKEDPFLDYPHEAFETNLSTSWGGKIGLKEFAAQRYAEISATLEAMHLDCSLVTEIPDDESADLKLYPMPVEDILYIESIGGPEIRDVVIMNNVGQIVLHAKPDETGAINVEHLPSGCYFLKALSNNTSYSRVIIIK